MRGDTLGNYCVYKHVSPSGKIYIGITGKNPIHRWNGGNGYKSNTHFWRAICKYGWDSFQHEIIIDSLSKSDAAKLEKELIKLYKSNDQKYGYNITDGGETNILPASSLKKISEANKGHTVSDETRKRMSESRKQLLKRNPRLVATRCGSKMTAEHKEKFLLAGQRSIKKQIQCIETGIIYESLTAACKSVGVNITCLSEMLHGKQKSAGGYTWRFVEVVT